MAKGIVDVMYRIAENVGGETIGEFGELMANRQSFLPQFYGN